MVHGAKIKKPLSGPSADPATSTIHKPKTGGKQSARVFPTALPKLEISNAKGTVLSIEKGTHPKMIPAKKKK